MLLLRMLVAVTSIVETVLQVRSSAPSPYGWLIAALIFTGACCLLLGFLTPIMAGLIGLTAVVLVFSSLPFSIQILDIAVLSTAIALLGPGAFSIDARMFGRREILIPNVTRCPKP